MSAQTVHQHTRRPRELSEGFAFCGASNCDVVYARPSDGTRLGCGALRVAVYPKSSDPSCPVCYCFAHTIAAIEADAARHGRSTIADAITAACRRGEDHCETSNPQGRCCLSNVRAVAGVAGGERCSVR